jgi:hypothetical protein
MKPGFSTVETNRIPAFKYYLPFILFLLIIGWGGFAIVLRFTVPTLAPRWFFFFFLVIGLTGLGIPSAFQAILPSVLR